MAGESKDKEAPQQSKSQPEVKKDVETPLQARTLAVIMGDITRKIMAERTAIADCRRDFRIWYEAQSVEDRRKFALDTRKELENFKAIGELFFLEAVQISAQDL